MVVNDSTKNLLPIMEVDEYEFNLCINMVRYNVIYYLKISIKELVEIPEKSDSKTTDNNNNKSNKRINRNA